MGESDDVEPTMLSNLTQLYFVAKAFCCLDNSDSYWLLFVLSSCNFVGYAFCFNEFELHYVLHVTIFCLDSQAPRKVHSMPKDIKEEEGSNECQELNGHVSECIFLVIACFQHSH